MLTKKNVTYIMSALILSGISSASANESSTDKSAITLGLGAISSPRYSGYNEQSVGGVPLFHYQQDNFYIDSMNGIGIHLQSDNGLYLEPTIGYNSGRTDKNSGRRKGSDKLKGMGNISASVNTGITLGWAVTPWLVFEGKATLPLSESQGVSYSTSVDYIPIMDKDDSLTLRASALFGDSRYLNTWYGVNSEQSTRSGYARYNSSAGFYGTDASVTWVHQFTEHWGGLVSVDYAWLDKTVASSPIVMQRGGTTGIVAINYTF